MKCIVLTLSYKQNIFLQFSTSISVIWEFNKTEVCSRLKLMQYSLSVSYTHLDVYKRQSRVSLVWIKISRSKWFLMLVSWHIKDKLSIRFVTVCNIYCHSLSTVISLSLIHIYLCKPSRWGRPHMHKDKK